VQQQRCRELANLEGVLRTQYYEQLIGRKLRVLVETIERDGVWTGTSCRYATVEITDSAAREGKFAAVIARGIVGDRLKAGTGK